MVLVVPALSVPVGTVYRLIPVLMMLPKIIRLDVNLRDAREVERLRARIRELETELDKARTKANRCEFDLVCQQRINLGLQDYCREHGLKLPARLMHLWQSSYRPDEE